MPGCRAPRRSWPALLCYSYNPCTWLQVLASTITARLTPLPASQAAAAVGAWLSGAADEVAGAGGALLAACRTAEDLAGAEAAVRAAIAGWHATAAPPPGDFWVKKIMAFFAVGRRAVGAACVSGCSFQ